LVNFLRDNPMTQFSIRWILSLNRLSQKWGQVQRVPVKNAAKGGVSDESRAKMAAAQQKRWAKVKREKNKAAKAAKAAPIAPAAV